MEKFGRLAFKGVPDELEDPSGSKEDGGVEPEVVKKKASYKKYQGNKDRRNTQGVAGPVDRMLMAARVLRDPLLACTPAQHAGMIHRRSIAQR